MLKHARTRKKRYGRSMEDSLDLSAMVDIVFLLLIFFIVTMRPMDVLAELPAGQGIGPPDVDVIHITITEHDFVIDDRRVHAAGLSRILQRLVEIKPDQSVSVACPLDSKHEQLIEVLDLCHAAGINKMSVRAIR